MEAFQEILQSYREGSTVSITEFVLLLSIELVAAAAIYFHFRRFGESASSQDNFASILPVVSLTTFLVISVVKTSLALSLGLVGALSIVRFRTPIKDAEELAYIFLAITAGIGLAAGQVMVTVITMVVILIVIAIVKRSRDRGSSENTYISIDIEDVKNTQTTVQDITEILSDSATHFALQRCEIRNKILHLSYQAKLSSPEAMAVVPGRIGETFENSGVCFIDESTTPKP